MADTRWRIVNDVSREDLTPGGTFQTVREITFEHLATGRTGTVIVPVRLYTADYVRTVVSEAVAHIAAVADLSGE